MITTIQTINFAEQITPPVIPVIQGDTGRNIQFEIADYTIPEGATATYYIQKPSGNAVYNTASISGNHIVVELTAQAIAETGSNHMQVRLALNDEIITSFDILLLVYPFRGVDAIESLTEMNVFDKAVEQAEEAIDGYADTQKDAIEAKGQEVIESIPADYTELSNEVTDLKADLNYFEDTLAKRYYPSWETGYIDSTTGTDSDDKYTRNSGYIEKSTVSNFTVTTHSGALYVYRYNYNATTGEYTYLGRNQRTNFGNFTEWLKGLDCTHFRIAIATLNANPNAWLYVGVDNAINQAANIAKSAFTNAENIRYWRHTFSVSSGETHSAVMGEIPVLIPSGHKFSIKEKTNIVFSRQVFAYYSDGSNERLYNYSTTYESPQIERNFTVAAKEKDITSFSVYIDNSQRDANVEITLEVFVEDSLSGYEGYPYQTNYYITNEDLSLTCFEGGKPRNLVQAIAVVNNEVWEFAQGKAYYNGTEYTLNNGHGNNCNWGTALHGTYPYLYCPTWTQNEMNINVFSFDGTEFTLVDTIHFEGYTGYLNAYVDETDGFIYAFIFADNAAGRCHYLVSDLSGNVIFEKDLPYLIRTMQGLCMHDGVIYAVAGYGNTASPNYLYKISPDGTLLCKSVMGAIGNLGEIEGIDFLDNEMIIATYSNFYIHPHRVPRTLRKGYVKQLEASE